MPGEAYTKIIAIDKEDANNIGRVSGVELEVDDPENLIYVKIPGAMIQAQDIVNYLNQVAFSFRSANYTHGNIDENLNGNI